MIFPSYTFGIRSGLSVIIRECNEKDLCGVLLIENASFDKPFSESLFKELYINFRRGFRVAESANKLIGYSIIFPYRGGDTMILMSVAVDPDYRRKRIGSALLQDAISLAGNLGARRLILQVAKENLAANNLYIRFGFRQMKNLPNYYGAGKDGFEMALSTT